MTVVRCLDTKKDDSQGPSSSRGSLHVTELTSGNSSHDDEDE